MFRLRLERLDHVWTMLGPIWTILFLARTDERVAARRATGGARAPATGRISFRIVVTFRTDPDGYSLPGVFWAAPNLRQGFGASAMARRGVQRLQPRPPLRHGTSRRHQLPKPRNGPQTVRFGSPDLRTSALGVKRVRGSVSPWSRGRPKPKKAPNCQNSKICPRSIFQVEWVKNGSDYNGF